MVTGQYSGLERETTNFFSRIGRKTFLTLSRAIAPYKPNLREQERRNRTKLFGWINNEMNLYEQSSSPRTREAHLHNAYAGLTRHLCLNTKQFTLLEDLLRYRFLGLVAVPRFQEDAALCNKYLGYFLAA